MKPINEMNLVECIDALCEKHFVDEHPIPVYKHHDKRIAIRIHDLTRWIPVEERLPTKEDGYKSKYATQRTVLVMQKWGDISVATIELAKHFTHWRRIDKPEGV
jgi:hypothetical protein